MHLRAKSHRVPYLIADFLLVLFPVTGTAEAEQDNGDDEEDQQDSDYGSRDDAGSIRDWTTQRRERVKVLGVAEYS